MKVRLNVLGIIILTLFGYYDLAYAVPSLCTLNGSWSIGYGMKMDFVEINSEVSLMTPIPHPICGDMIIKGVNDGKSFVLNLITSHPDCKIKMIYEGNFTTENCNDVVGKVTVKQEGRSDMKYPFMWYRDTIKIIKPETNAKFVISAEPSMPNVQVEALPAMRNSIEYLTSAGRLDTKEPPYAWQLKIEHNTIPGKMYHHTKIADKITNDLIYRPDFNLLEIEGGDNAGDDIGGIMGGEMTISINHYGILNDKKTYEIAGTNPGMEAIDTKLDDPTTRLIACYESSYKQFNANRESGIGMPVVGSSKKKTKCGIGIMQICNRKSVPAVVWNWKYNLQMGIEKFQNNISESEKAHISERDKLNRDRKEANLPKCPPGIPTKLSESQILEESIRRYNCGREFRWEPWDAPDCKGKWVRDQSCDWVEGIEDYDDDYIQHVKQCVITD